MPNECAVSALKAMFAFEDGLRLVSLMETDQIARRVDLVEAIENLERAGSAFDKLGECGIRLDNSIFSITSRLNGALNEFRKRESKSDRLFRVDRMERIAFGPDAPTDEPDAVGRAIRESRIRLITMRNRLRNEIEER